MPRVASELDRFGSFQSFFKKKIFLQGIWSPRSLFFFSLG